MSTAGFVIAAAVMLILGYFVPSLVRRRQTIGDARVHDRFSASLRVVERRGRPTDGVPLSTTSLLPASRPVPALAAPATARAASPARAEEPTVNRPTGMAERRSAQEARRVAAVRAAIAARRAEQAAAARRRLVVTLALVTVTAVAWLAVVLADFSVLLAVFSSLVLVAVLVLGVRAAKAERAEWADVPASLVEPRAAVVAGPTYSPAELRSHLAAAGAATTAAPSTASEPAEAAADATSGRLRWQTDEPAEVSASTDAAAGTWTPVPVPVPTYTLKAEARRREDVAPDGELDSAGDLAAAQVAPEGAGVEAQAAGAPDAEVPGIDLTAVLARRRASA
ncbi:MAG TPA: hypothetical protein DHV14_09295 [Micrococcales bacterium]|uniref:hypothetical protein n=1 Tax=Miniimonas arenae TaxID=676201 RepID=UPI000EC8BDAD|nr:hypothetical protein [Miniimonas arenae]HCX85307.1 hypothetical protein [Micrococcales bacterium]